ncbi:hypothetical protein CEXT_277301 [Caerostris extrusa]|uniref:Reverse transcriptase domain-containing protein n=1 Tax=Caerostris extrusa TaxID=172846 RepID=A0AAV4VQS3_CAEEX|nr:hypothetical protein CEXT_277301 [Caerostris extrusa]
MCIEPIIRKIQGCTHIHQVLAFGDDIALLADSLELFQDLLNTIISILGQLSLKLNPRKSHSVMYLERPQRKSEILFSTLMRLA